MALFRAHGLEPESWPTRCARSSGPDEHRDHRHGEPVRLDPATYVPHAIHTPGDRTYTETNCYSDILIELIHARGDEPLAVWASRCGWTSRATSGPLQAAARGPGGAVRDRHPRDAALPAPAAADRRADRRRADDHRRARLLVSARHRVDELPERSRQDLGDRRGDRPGRRAARYFHNTSLHQLEGEDFAASSGSGANSPRRPAPYTELVRFDDGRGCAAPSCARRQAGCCAGTSSAARRRTRSSASAPGSRTTPTCARARAAYHAYAFATIRLCGATFEWPRRTSTGPRPGGTTASAALRRIVEGSKVLSLRRAWRGEFDPRRYRGDGQGVGRGDDRARRGRRLNDGAQGGRASRAAKVDLAWAGRRPRARGERREARRLDWQPARVPGTATAVLANAPRDPTGATSTPVVESDRFGRRPRPARRCLRLDGIATVADVFLNGELVLEAVDAAARRRRRRAGARRRRARDPLPPSLRCWGRRPARWRTRLVTNQNLRCFRTTLLGRAPVFAPGRSGRPWRPVSLERHRRLAVEELRLRPTLAPATGGWRSSALAGSRRAAPPVEVEVGGVVQSRRDPHTRRGRADVMAAGTSRCRAGLVAAHPRRSAALRGPLLSTPTAAVAVDAGRVGFRPIAAGLGGGTDPATGLDLHLNGVASSLAGRLDARRRDRPRARRARAAVGAHRGARRRDQHAARPRHRGL